MFSLLNCYNCYFMFIFSKKVNNAFHTDQYIKWLLIHLTITKIYEIQLKHQILKKHYFSKSSKTGNVVCWIRQNKDKCDSGHYFLEKNDPPIFGFSCKTSKFHFPFNQLELSAVHVQPTSPLKKFSHQYISTTKKF